MNYAKIHNINNKTGCTKNSDKFVFVIVLIYIIFFNFFMF